MKASEILRKLADVIDGQTDDQETASTEITNRPDQTSVDIPTDTKDIESQAQVNVATMVPPLQQKLDLLKSIAGEDDDTPCDGEQAPDELDIMKQNAGIKVIAASELADANDIEN